MNQLWQSINSGDLKGLSNLLNKQSPCNECCYAGECAFVGDYGSADCQYFNDQKNSEGKEGWG